MDNFIKGLILVMKLVVLDDQLLEKLATYYSHPFVEANMPWVKEMGFDAFVTKELERLQQKCTTAIEKTSLQVV
jgi:hypothetical protein